MIPFHLLATVLEYIIQGRLIYNDFWIGYKNQFLFTPLQRESQGSAYSQYMIKIESIGKIKIKKTNKSIYSCIILSWRTR